MKTRHVKISLLMAASVLTSGSAFGATYAVNAGSGTTANGIAPSSGPGFAGNGIVALGVFEGSVDFSLLTSPAGFVSAFTQFGSSTPFLSSGLLGNSGQFQLSTNGSASDAPFAGSNFHLFVGNGNTFADSSEFLVLRNPGTFNATDDDSGTPIDVIFSESSEVLWGTTDPDIRTSNIDNSETPGFRTAEPIPEPTVAILGLLGGLGLLRRRR